MFSRFDVPVFPSDVRHICTIITFNSRFTVVSCEMKNIKDVLFSKN